MLLMTAFKHRAGIILSWISTLFWHNESATPIKRKHYPCLTPCVKANTSCLCCHSAFFFCMRSYIMYCTCSSSHVFYSSTQHGSLRQTHYLQRPEEILEKMVTSWGEDMKMYLLLGTNKWIHASQGGIEGCALSCVHFPDTLISCFSLSALSLSVCLID